MKKDAIKVWTARFVRKAAGRISKREAARLGRLYGGDIHWKYLGTAGDKLALRAPGAFASRWSATHLPYKKYWREDLARHLAYFFTWYGPQGGLWPGDDLVLVPPARGHHGGGWRLRCAPSCVCNACTAARKVESTPALPEAA